MTETNKDKVRNNVRDTYADIVTIASSTDDCGCAPTSACCGPTETEAKSQYIGYSAEELKALPEGANLGLGCGNPQAIANLKEGETVLDLGSGAGIDCFLAATQVGATGKVIGVDMTPQMLSKARSNAEDGGHTNVEFRLGEIENIPVADGTIDVIMSNCVINLSPDKQRVFDEAFRVLKVGGRLAISDIVAIAEMPDEMRNDSALYSACISGAIFASEIESMLDSAGFSDIRIQDKGAKFEDFREYIISANIEAVKAR